jgi:hypothetical protein
MKFLSVLTVPAAFALIVASTTSPAQDKPNPAATSKPSSTANAPAKAKPTWQGSTRRPASAVRASHKAHPR